MCSDVEASEMCRKRRFASGLSVSVLNTGGQQVIACTCKLCVYVPPGIVCVCVCVVFMRAYVNACHGPVVAFFVPSSSLVTANRIRREIELKEEKKNIHTTRLIG